MHFPSFKEFFLENMKGERKSKFRNSAHSKGSNMRAGKDGKPATLDGANNTYDWNRKESEAKEILNNIRRGDVATAPLTPEVMQHISSHKTNLKLPQRPGEQVAIGRGAGADNNKVYKDTLTHRFHKKQVVVERDPRTNQLRLRGV